MKTLVTGATGLVGRRLLGEIDRPVVVSRDPEAARALLGPVETCGWEADGALAPAALADVDTVFHLAGEPVAVGRWTREKKERIRRSRVDTTRAVVEAIRRAARRPSVLVSASAVGFYGSRGDEVLSEGCEAGQGFLPEVCRAWEEEALAATSLGVRVVTARIGIVLSPHGGALARILPAFRMGVGGPLGSGEQWMPWVHVDDVVGVLLHAARTPSVEGAIDVVGPHPVTNHEFASTLGRLLRRPALVPVPEAALRLAFGELSHVLLASQRVLPRVALWSGYRFRFTTVQAALCDVLGVGPPAENAAAARS